MGSNPGQTLIYLHLKKRKLAEFLVQTAKAGYGKSRKQRANATENAAHDKRVIRSRLENIQWMLLSLYEKATPTNTP